MKSLWLLLAMAVLFLSGCGPHKKSAESPPQGLCDDFNLPLVIQIAAPEVPPEIQKPSLPLKDAARDKKTVASD